MDCNYNLWSIFSLWYKLVSDILLLKFFFLKRLLYSVWADSQERLPSHQQNCNSVTKLTKNHKATILPTYLVGLDVLKSDQFAYKPVVVHRNTQCWQQHFSITLATWNLLQNGLHADGSLSHGADERIEVRGAWSKQLSFQWRNGVGVVASNYHVIFPVYYPFIDFQILFL